MKSFDKVSVKSKIWFGYIVLALLCGVIGVLTYLQLESAGNSGILVLAIVILAIVFALVYGLKVCDVIVNPIKKIKFVLDELCKGHLSEVTGVRSEDELGQAAKSLDFFIELLKKDLIGAIENIADGNVSVDFVSKDEKDEIVVVLNNVSSIVKKINKGVADITDEVLEGKLSTRGDETLYHGVWKDLIHNINNLIEAFVNPINVTSNYIDRLSKGDIPAKITDTYRGDFNIIKDNLNNCIDIMNGLLQEANTLISAAEQGKLDVRGETHKFTGAWKQLVVEINTLVETVVNPIREVSGVMQELSQGNLELSIKGTYKGEFGDLGNAVNITIERLHAVVAEISSILSNVSNGNLLIDEVQKFDGNFESISVSLNRIIESLNSTLGEIHTAADQVSVGSIQVADGSQLLAQGATEQASSIEELTASVTQVAAQTKENATNANQANALVLKIKENALQGNGHMGEMLDAMAEINEASANISKVIKVIDDIAFQTNILALNAAVEAARAGQHGKGFAVVAEEVRNLAARSANAAKETTSLIEGSISRAQRGKDIAGDTAKALNEIVEGVSTAADLIAGIAVSSNEQASGISQINIGINQVSDVVQTNSATSEESAAASQELSGQADLLKSLVNQFQIKGKGMGYQNNKKRDSYRTAHYDTGNDYHPIAGKPQIILSDSEFGKY